MSYRMTGKTAYINARLLDPATNLDAPGMVLTEGEEIVAVGSTVSTEGAFVIDCGGACLSPGLVDMRVQLREPGFDHMETMRTAGEAAVAGGVTSMICLPNTDPPLDDEAMLEFVARRARLVELPKVYAYGACTIGLEGKALAEMAIMAESGACGFTDGVKAIADAQMMTRVLSYAATFDLLILQHPEEPSLATGVMNAGARATRMGLAGIPREAEIIMLERDLRLAALTGARYHAAHISTGESVALIRTAKEKGLKVSCDTAPFYFALTEDSVQDYRTFAKLSPPLRSEEDRQAIVEGIREGVIDCIASDHSPQDQDNKRQTFAQAACGAVGLETLLPISLGLYHSGRISLVEVMRRLTANPAGLLNLKAGKLMPGSKADLTIFDPDVPWTIDADTFRSKSKNSPFDGVNVRGKVLRTVIDGRTVYEA